MHFQLYIYINILFIYIYINIYIYKYLIYIYIYINILFIYIYIYIYFRVTLLAYGCSQARGPIGTVTASLCQSHSNGESKPCLWPTPQLNGNVRSLTHWARPGMEPATSWFLEGFVNHCTTTGTPRTHL